MPDRPRRARLLFILVFVLCVLGLGVRFLKSFLAGGTIDDVARHLPASTQAFVAGKGAADLALEFNQLKDLVESSLTFAREAMDGQEGLDIDGLGFDPLSLMGWRSTGIDFGRPWALSSSNNPASPESVTLLLPIADETVFGPILLGVLEALNIERRSEDLQGREVTVLHNTVAFTMDADYLVLTAASDPTDDPLSALVDHFEALKAGSLLEKEEFSELSEALGDDWHFMTYGSGSLFSDLPETLGMSELVQWILPVQQFLPRSFAFTVHLDDQHLRARYAFLTETDFSPFLSTARDEFATSISGDALAAARISVNAEAIWERLLAEPEIRAALGFSLAALELGSDVEIESDLIGNLKGSLSLVLLAAPKDQQTPLDLLIYAGLKDPEAAARAISHLCTMGSIVGLSLTPSEDAGSTWCGSDLAGFGLARDHLVFASGEAGSSVLSSRDGEGFVTSLPSSTQEELLSGSPFYAYLDIPGWFELLREDALPQDLVALRDDLRLDTLPEDLPLPIEGFSLHADAQGKALLLDASIHAAEGGFQAQILSASEDFFQAWETGLNTQQVGELEQYVDSIRLAELGYDAAFGEILSCGSEKAALQRVKSRASRTATEKNCWMELGFLLPTSGHYGFWVEVSGEEFSVHGLVDADGDGVPAHVLANRSSSAQRVTPSHVR